MAGGEKAKKSGEYGEKIVANLLELIGWHASDDGITVPCINEEAHSINERNSKKHGIDYVYQYRSMLRDALRQDVLISVKCREGYPKKEPTIRRKFKEFFDDLLAAAECYPASEPYKRIIKNTKNRSHSGIVFWIDRERNDRKEYESVTDSLVNIRLPESKALESVVLVDNNRAQFIYESLSHVHSKYGESNVEFFYIDTGLNNSNLDKLYSGPSMPVEYLSADVLPLHITQGESKVLYLIIKDEFDKDYLKRLIGLAQDLTKAWANEIIIAFPDYNKFEHEKYCNDAKLEFDDSKFTKNIYVTTYKPDFRDEV